ncbi:MAG: S41 family peptidase [Candidatus Binatia bacterium]
MSRWLIAIAVSAACALTAYETLSFAASTLDYGLNLIQRYYLFQDDVRGSELLGKALDYLELSVPQFTSETVSDGTFIARAGSCELKVESEPDANIASLVEPLHQIGVMVSKCVTDLPDGIPDLESLILAGVLSGLDPYSTLFDQIRHTEHAIQFRGKLAGIGARVGIRNDELTLIKVYDGSPAARAGLEDGDVVKRIDGMSATNIMVGDAVQRIRGPVGSKVALAVERAGTDDVETYTVTRDLVTIPSVTAELLPNGVVFSTISHFSQSTPGDFREILTAIVEEHPDTKGIIVDLRANSGGSMIGASSIADLFLSKGVLITTAGRQGMPVSGLRAEIDASEDAPLQRFPVAFLTSPRTASGSELLAASLRNNDRAIIVGERSFGKGTVQKTYKMGEGSALKLTVGRFLPNRVPIPGGGMIPDVELQGYDFTEDGVRVRGYRDGAELPFWLQTPRWAESRKREPAVRISVAREVPAQDESMDRSEDDAGPDPARDIASALLRRYGSVSASEMLSSAKSFLGLKLIQSDMELSEFLENRGLDWKSAPSASSGHFIEINVKANADGILRAGEEATITVTVTNKGKDSLFRLRGVTKSEMPFLDARGLLFGRLGPGEAKSWDFRVTLPTFIRTGRQELEVELLDDYGLLDSVGPFFMAIESATRPEIAYRYRVSADEDGSSLVVKVQLDNRGGESSEELRVFLKHPLSSDFQVLDVMHPVEPLAAGSHREIELKVQRLAPPEKQLETTLAISDRDFRVALETTLPLSPTDDYSPWQQAPAVVLELSQRPDPAGEYRVFARASDESGLASVLATVDGNKVDYVEATNEPLKDVEIAIPWNPSVGVKDYTITAVDRAGLTTVYHAGL